VTVKINKHLSSELKVNKGLRQRDEINLLLFNMCWKSQLEDQNWKLGEPYLTNLVKSWNMLFMWLL
jgi:hypothetical protein